MINENLLRACYYLVNHPGTEEDKFVLINKLRLDDWADIYTFEGAVMLLQHTPEQLKTTKEELADNILKNTPPIQQTTRVPSNYTLKEQLAELKTPFFDFSILYNKLFLSACGIDERGVSMVPERVIDENLYTVFREQFAALYKTMYMQTLEETLNQFYIVLDNENRIVNTSFLQSGLEIASCRCLKEIKNRANVLQLYTTKKLYNNYLKYKENN